MVGDRALQHAVVVEQVDAAPVGDARDDGARDRVERLLPVERAREHLAGEREELEALLGRGGRVGGAGTPGSGSDSGTRAMRNRGAVERPRRSVAPEGLSLWVDGDGSHWQDLYANDDASRAERRIWRTGALSLLLHAAVARADRAARRRHEASGHRVGHTVAAAVGGAGRAAAPRPAPAPAEAAPPPPAPSARQARPTPRIADPAARHAAAPAVARTRCAGPAAERGARCRAAARRAAPRTADARRWKRDLSSYIASRRAARGESPAGPSTTGRDSDAAKRERAIAQNLAGLNEPRPLAGNPRNGGGLFQITLKSYDFAEFRFYGWNAEIQRQAPQRIEVRKGANPSIDIAIVRRMIAIIRETQKGDFVWRSDRVGRRRDAVRAARGQRRARDLPDGRDVRAGRAPAERLGRVARLTLLAGRVARTASAGRAIRTNGHARVQPRRCTPSDEEPTHEDQTPLHALAKGASTRAATFALLVACAAWAPFAQRSVTLSGANEVPPVSSRAAGSGTVTVGPDSAGDGEDHRVGHDRDRRAHPPGRRGRNGPVIVPFTKTGDNTFEAAAGAKMTAEQFAAYKAGNTYVNVHSAAHPGGEVRAQLKP